MRKEGMYMDKVKAICIVIKDFVKEHLKIVLGVLAALAVLIIAYNVIVGSPKRPVKNLIKAIDSGDLSKIEKYVDMKGAYVYLDACELNYKDFDKEYKKFKKTDDYNKFVDSLEEYRDEAEEDLKEYKVSAKLDRIVSVEKVTKKLYKVKTKIDVDVEDEDETTWTVDFYVMKSGLSYKVIGADKQTIGDIF